MPNLTKSVAMTDGGGGIKRKKAGTTNQTAQSQTGNTASGYSTTGNGVKAAQPGTHAGIPTAADKNRFASSQRQSGRTDETPSGIPQPPEKRAFATRRFQADLEASNLNNSSSRSFGSSTRGSGFNSNPGGGFGSSTRGSGFSSSPGGGFGSSTRGSGFSSSPGGGFGSSTRGSGFGSSTRDDGFRSSNRNSSFSEQNRNQDSNQRSDLSAEAMDQDRLNFIVAGENIRYNGMEQALVGAAMKLPLGTEAQKLIDQASIALQAEILGKLEELEAAKKQAGGIQTSEQLLEFTRTIGRLEQELEALEQGRLSDRLDSEALGRLSEAVQDWQRNQTAATITPQIASTDLQTLQLARENGNLTENMEDGKLDHAAQPDYYASSNGKVLLAEYKDWLGENQRDKYMASVDDNYLKTIIGEIYRPGSIIGDGGTADSIRFERETGILLCRTGHIQKGRDMIRCLERFLKTDGLSLSDQLRVNQLLSDLREAVEGG